MPVSASSHRGSRHCLIRQLTLGLCLLALACAVLALADPANAAPTFSRSSVAVGDKPTAAVAADFDRDGLLDLVVTNGGADSISFLAGDGDGTFAAPLVSAAGGGGPFGVVAADFNSDGQRDIAVANRYGNSVSIHTGDGSGSFSVLRSIAVGSNPLGIAAVDLNRDGRVDIVVGHIQSAFISVLTGNGAGAFTRQDTSVAALGMTNLATGDLDDDGDLDVAVAHLWGDLATVLLGDGAGHLTPRPTIPVSDEPLGVACPDLDGDGHLELCVAGSTPSYLNVFDGDGSGSFSAPAQYACGDYPKVVAAADLNLDGPLDLVTCNYESDTLSVFTGYGNGMLAPQTTVATGTDPHYVVAADFDADGRPDLAVPNEGSDNVTILMNTTPYSQVDVTPPVTTSSTDSAWHRGAVTVTLTATDAQSGVDYSRYRVDGSAWQTGTSFVVGGDGVHSVQFYSVDNAGNAESTKSAQVKIDGAAPVTTSSTDSAWHRSAVTVTLTATDAQSGVDYTRYRVDGAAWQTGTSFVVSGDGVHSVQFYSVDNAGNAESTKSAQVKIDTTAPSVTVTTPQNGASYIQGSVVTCDWTCGDTGSGVASEATTIDGAGVAEGSRIDTLPFGPHVFRLTVTDVAGNQRTVTVDYTIPVPHSTSLVADPLLATIRWGGSAVLRATLTDIDTATPLDGQAVQLEWSSDKVEWTAVDGAPTASTRGAAGEYEFTAAPVLRTYYRFRFTGNGAHASTVSEPIVVRVRPVLSKPQAPSSVRVNRAFTVWGTLRPQFPAGTKTVTIKVVRFTGTKWVTYRTYTATNANSGSDTRYSLRLHISRHGKYRFRASTDETAQYAAASTDYSRTILIR